MPTEATGRDDGGKGRLVILILGLAVVYVVTARLGLLLALPPEYKATAVWPPSGIALAALLFFGRRVWPGVWAGAFLANLWDFFRVADPTAFAAHVAASAGIALGSTLQALAAAALLRWAVSDDPLASARRVFLFVGVALSACVVAASFGVTSLYWGGFAPGSALPNIWWTWWLGDATGILLFTPLLLAWVRPTSRPDFDWREAALGTILTSGVGLLVFGWSEAVSGITPMAYLTIPLVVWAAVRFGPRGATACLILVSGLAVWGTANGVGPFVRPTLNESLLLLQLFMGVVALTALVLAAALAERDRTEGQLRDSEARFRTIFEQAAVGAALIDTATGRFVRVNRRYCHLIGYTPEEMTRTTFMALTHPDDLPHDLAQMKRLVAGEIGEFTMEKRLFHKNGSDVWINLTVSPTWIAGEAPEHHIAIVEDITARRRAEDSLRASEERYRVLTEALPHMVWTMRPDLNLEFLNRNAAEFTGYTVERANRDGWQHLVHPDDLPGMMATVGGPLSRGESHEAEYRFRHQTGEYRWVQSRAVPVKDASGAVTQWVGSTLDLHDRRTAENQLRASERRHRALIQATPQVVWTTNGAENGAALWWLELTGQSADEAAGWGWLDAVHPDDRERVRTTWASAYEAHTLYDTEYRVRTRHGEYRHFAVRGVALTDAAGKLEEWVGTLTDIHDKKEAENRLRDMNATLEHRVEERTEALQESEQRFRSAFEFAPIGIALVGTDGRWLKVNHSLCEIVGYGEPELLATDFQTITHPDDLAADLGLARQVLDGTIRTYQMEKRYFHKHGHIIHILLSVSLVRDADEAPLYFISQIKDITQRKRVELALRESQNLLALALQAAHAGVWHLDIAARRFVPSERALALHGLPPDAVLDHDGALHCVHPDDRAGVGAALGRTLAGGVPYRTEYRVAGVRDSRWLASFANVQPGPDGPRLVGLVQDITARKLTEQALAANDALLRQFIKHSPAAIAMFDRGVRYVQASDRWLTDYGLAGRDIIGRSHYDVFPDIPDRWKAIHRRVLTGTIERCAEDPFARADGSTTWLQWECQPWYAAGGEVGGLIMFTQVITERKLAEERVRASLREKEVLLKEIHHRVKNNLQIVSALLDLQSGYTDDPKALEMFHESRGRVKSMALIHERLYRSHDMARVNFTEYVEQLADDLYRTYKLSGGDIRLELDIDAPALPLDVAIPCGLLLNELVSNCLKHAFKDATEGRIRVSLTADESGTNVLVVSDDGIGFPAGTDFRNTKSFGLQLVNTLTEQLDGEIELSSDRGATFTIRFQAAKTREPIKERVQ